MLVNVLDAWSYLLHNKHLLGIASAHLAAEVVAERPEVNELAGLQLDVLPHLLLVGNLIPHPAACKGVYAKS